ncbi:hypothetical protein [Plantactinospora sp. GCM10030261]|uniref:hypothetical protein n=1 Tax=Plantactinospora sp. GCM10030261 TaxID=3273420 RepID=UPI00361081D9
MLGPGKVRQRLLRGRTAMRAAFVATAAALALTVTATPAMADVIVPPGGAGHVCSNYDRTNPAFIWQSCAWADNNEVYFTIHYANNTGGIHIARLRLGFIQNGWYWNCFDGIYLIAEGYGNTRTADCARTRMRAAYQATGSVDGITKTSDTLQVQ